MFRFVTPFAALLLLATLSACKVNTLSTPTTPSTATPSTPAGTATVSLTPSATPAIPETARPVEQTTALGSITRRAEQTPQTTELRKLLDAFCQDGLMIIQTSRETIYAALPCDRFWDEQAKQQFFNKQVAVVLEVTQDRLRVLIETLDGAQAEFTTDGLWVR